MTRTELEILQPGDWVSMKYGTSSIPIDFYVVENPRQGIQAIKLCRPNWLTSAAIWMRFDDLLSGYYHPKIIATHTKRKWWYGFLPVWVADCVCPYKKP